MAGGFHRRFSQFPSLAVLTEIEGVDIVDQTPPATPTGVPTGVIGMIGEFADMRFAVAVSTLGVVTTATRPVEIFSGGDQIDKLGGWDETLGDFGKTGGNGFVAYRSKAWSRRIAAVVNLCSSRGIRTWRDLPTCKSAADPTPITPVAAAVVGAGREFKSGTNRVRLGTRVLFAGTTAYASAADGSVTNAGGVAATQTFNSASAKFLTAKSGAPVKKGDILVLGVIGGAGALGANAFTFRVTADAVSDTALVVEKMAGTSFDWTSGNNLPYRVHDGAVADSGGAGFALADAGGYLVPARPLDVTVAAATALTPTVVPPAGAASGWDPLSGLTARTMPGGTDLVFTAALQAPNAGQSAGMDAAYQTALDALKGQGNPTGAITVVFSARTSSAIRAALKQHAIDVSAVGRGRVAVVSPALDVQDTGSAVADAAAALVSTLRDESLFYSWPGAMQSMPEAARPTQNGGVTAIKVADGTTTLDGMLDVKADAFLASVLSILATHRNPGEVTETTARALAAVLGYQRGVVDLEIGDFVTLKDRGVCALRLPPDAQVRFQSGVTTSLVSGQKNINRRLYANMIEDTVADVVDPFNKLPLTADVRDAAIGEVHAYLQSQLSPDNAAAATCQSYSVDETGNSKELFAAGVYVLSVKVQMIATADKIVIPATIGPGVDTST